MVPYVIEQQPCTLLLLIISQIFLLVNRRFQKHLFYFYFLFWEGSALLDCFIAPRIQGVKAARALALALTPWILGATADRSQIVR